MKKPAARPETEWIQVPAPALRIVSDELWSAVHARLGATREMYLRQTGGRLWGRPLNGIAAKYLLTGLARCGLCGGTLEVRSRNHGRRRGYFYACSSFYRRGRTVCSNRLEIPMPLADRAVLEAVEQDLLSPEVVALTLRKLIDRMTPSEDDCAREQAKLAQDLEGVEQEIGNLTRAITVGGELRALVEELKKRETRRREIRARIEGLDARAKVGEIDTADLLRLVHQRIAEWREVLHRQIPQARQIISKLLRDRLMFTPERRGTVNGYRFRATGTLTKLLSGFAPGFSQAVASPSGIDAVCIAEMPEIRVLAPAA